MQEIKLQLDGTHEGDCKKLGEALTAGQRNILLLYIDEHVIAKVLYICRES